MQYSSDTPDLPKYHTLSEKANLKPWGEMVYDLYTKNINWKEGIGENPKNERKPRIKHCLVTHQSPLLKVESRLFSGAQRLETSRVIPAKGVGLS